MYMYTHTHTRARAQTHTYVKISVSPWKSSTPKAAAVLVRLTLPIGAQEQTPP